MLCTECHVRKGPELAQVGFDPAGLFDACEINREISLGKYGTVRSRTIYSTNICYSSPSIYFQVKMISHNAKCKLFSDSHGITIIILKPSELFTSLMMRGYCTGLFLTWNDMYFA